VYCSRGGCKQRFLHRLTMLRFLHRRYRLCHRLSRAGHSIFPRQAGRRFAHRIGSQNRSNLDQCRSHRKQHRAFREIGVLNFLERCCRHSEKHKLDLACNSRTVWRLRVSGTVFSCLPLCLPFGFCEGVQVVLGLGIQFFTLGMLLFRCSARVFSCF
jgi:hypothetical protein